MISTPSKPASRARSAALTNPSLVSLMSSRVISRGTRFEKFEYTGEGAIGSGPPRAPE